MKKKYLVIPAMAIALLAGAGAVSAQGPMGGGHGGFGGFERDPDQWLTRITADATMLGISVDEMKTAWSQGKTLQEVATEKGITQDQLKAKLKAAQETKQKDALQALVTKGYLTQAQADARLAAMKTRQAEAQTKRGNGSMMKGMEGRMGANR